ncbi:hypothetical protein D3C84_1244260 [compost metagenome]
MSIHPTTTDEEITYVCDSIKDLAKNHETWALDYSYNNKTNEFVHKNATSFEDELVAGWFKS